VGLDRANSAGKLSRGVAESRRWLWCSFVLPRTWLPNALPELYYLGHQAMLRWLPCGRTRPDVSTHRDDDRRWHTDAYRDGHAKSHCDGNSKSQWDGNANSDFYGKRDPDTGIVYIV